MRQTHVDIAEFIDVAEYRPMVGDFVIWAGSFSTWYGIVSEFSDESLKVIFESTPRLLFTLSETEMGKCTHTLDIEGIRSRSLRCYILHNGVWYV